MTTKTKGRDRGDGATPKTSADRDHTNTDPLVGWFNPDKPSRASRRQKRTWKRGRAGR